MGGLFWTGARIEMETFDETSEVTPAMWDFPQRWFVAAVDAIDAVSAIIPAVVEVRRQAEFLCNLPPHLGALIKLRSLNGRVIAETESGITMIVPKAY